MPDEIFIRLDGPPRGKGRPRFGRGRTYTDAATQRYEDAIRWEARTAMRGREPLTGPVKLRVYAEFPIPASWSKARKAAAIAGAVWHTGRPDLDNLIKCSDALNGIVWGDDSRVAFTTAWKKYGPDPHVKFIVSELVEV